MKTSRPLYNQNVIVDKINAYLKSKQRELTIERGYCHGFSLLWLYKMSEEKEAWFYNTIKKISSHQSDDFDDIEMDIEKLLAHIEWLQNSNEYINSVQQEDVDKLLDLPNKIGVPFVFNQRELDEVLTAIVPRSRMICLSGPTHTIGLFNRKNKFYLFDPNYDEGEPRVFNNIKDLRIEMINCLFSRFQYKTDKLPLSINIIKDKQEYKRRAGLSRAQKLALLKNLAVSSAKVNAPSNEGITPLYVASDNGDIDAAELYLSKGANPNFHEKHCRTSLCLSSEKGYGRFVKILLEHGANPNIKNDDGGFPLYFAAANGHEEVVSLLLNYNAKINLADQDGDTALHAAVSANQEGVSILLLRAGANCLLGNKAGQTPFQMAFYNRNWTILVSMLNHSGALAPFPREAVFALQTHKLEIMEAVKHLDHQDLKKKSALTELLGAFEKTQSSLFTPRMSSRLKRKRVEGSDDEEASRATIMNA